MNIAILYFRQSSLTEPVKCVYRIEKSFIVTDSVILELYLKIMAAITTKNTTKAVISTDDLKEMLECPVCYITFIIGISRTILKLENC